MHAISYYFNFRFSSGAILFFIMFISSFCKHNLTLPFITYSQCRCHFQFVFRFIMFFWPSKLFMLSCTNWFRQFWTVLSLLFFSWEGQITSMYTLTMAYFPFQFSLSCHHFSARISALVALHVYWDFSFSFVHAREYAIGSWHFLSFQPNTQLYVNCVNQTNPIK